ncbi:unnamed protein product [Urochloa humidicola]
MWRGPNHHAFALPEGKKEGRRGGSAKEGCRRGALLDPRCLRIQRRSPRRRSSAPCHAARREESLPAPELEVTVDSGLACSILRQLVQIDAAPEQTTAAVALEQAALGVDSSSASTGGRFELPPPPHAMARASSIRPYASSSGGRRAAASPEERERREPGPGRESRGRRPPLPPAPVARHISRRRPWRGSRGKGGHVASGVRTGWPPPAAAAPPRLCAPVASPAAERADACPPAASMARFAYLSVCLTACFLGARQPRRRR